MVILKTGIQCEACRKEAMHVVRVLRDVATVSCPFCGTQTDLARHRARIHALSEKYRAVEEFLDT